MKATCTCWLPYPNENLKRDNGNWRCKDCYECVKQTDGKHKTKCVRKEQGNEDSAGDSSGTREG